MSILIKGMRKPTHCGSCPMVDEYLGKCKLRGEEFSNWNEEYAHCPLIEVPDGHWIHEPGKIPKCSECGRYSDDADTGDAKYCPFCGAVIKEGE